jgi:CPA2 family monovalent cation:H+ antiporter-2
MELQIFFDIAIIFGVAIVVILVFNFFKIPHLVGYLITGIILSPNSTNIIHQANEVETFAEIGVILLLFTIGLEFSFSNLNKIKRYIIVGGGLQVILTIAVTTILIAFMGRSLPESIFWGFVIALSSSAIVIKMMQDKNEINTPYGKVTLAILLFQDIIVVPLMLFTPILAGNGEGTLLFEIASLIGKIILLIVISYVLTKYIIPKFFFQVMKIRNQEVFLIATIFFVITITLFTHYLGLSLALGAFVAGLIISETDYNRMAISCILPFRYVFISFFFISMGMLLDYQVFITQYLLIGFWFVFILFVKILVTTLSARVLKLSRNNALCVGLSLAQVGEFSFILALTGLSNGLISELNYQIFLSVSILTMALTPFLLERKKEIVIKIFGDERD